MVTPGANAADIEPSQDSAEQAVEYSLSPGLVARLANLEISIAFTSYQSSILYFLGRGREGAHLHQSGLPRAFCPDFLRVSPSATKMRSSASRSRARSGSRGSPSTSA
jgi:hypothetical protein